MAVNISNQQLAELRDAFSRLRPTVSLSGAQVSINDRRQGIIQLSISPTISPTYSQIRG